MNDLMSGGASFVEGSLRRQVKPARRRSSTWRGHRRHLSLGQGRRVTVATSCRHAQVGLERARSASRASLAAENAEKLTFADELRRYTIFGIRNVSDIPAALREAHRVLKRGGRLYVLEFSTSEWPGFGELYDRYSEQLIPRIGKAVAKDEDSYRYLVESIRRFPKMDAFRAMIGEAGFQSTSVEPILGGLVAIHGGWKI
jgi:demethylmenaquinone methyltransferase/2-methoxy-6-polyprenyl-1,4-benzoquinol methylase